MSQIFSAISVPLASVAKPFPAASKPVTRRHLLAAFALIGAAAVVPRLARAATDPLAVEVWKDPSCGCCKDWVAHMQDNGFGVTVHASGNNAGRSRLVCPIDAPSRIGKTGSVQGAAMVTTPASAARTRLNTMLSAEFLWQRARARLPSLGSGTCSDRGAGMLPGVGVTSS